MLRVVDAQIGKLNTELYDSNIDTITCPKDCFTVKGPRQNSVLKINIVEGEEPKFINLFGLSVDLESGDIALGLFPFKSEYVRVSNMSHILGRVWFNKDVHIVSKLDLKYILELLKIDPVYYLDEIYQEVLFQLENNSITSCKSISSSVIKTLHNHDSDTSIGYFKKRYSEGKLLQSLVEEMVTMYYKLGEFARSFYHNYISEQYQEDINANYGKSFKEILNTRNGAYVEALTVRYLKYDFPVVFLNALKSYGYNIKERKYLFNYGNSFRVSDYKGDSLIDIGIALSSGYYARKVQNKELILAYNIMDLLRACGWEQNLLVSLDIIIEQRNTNVWKALLNRFNVYDILKEQSLSEKSFVLGIDDYRNNVLLYVDTGTCYKRAPLFNQYRMVSFSSYQIEKAGEVLDEAFHILLKGMNF